MFNKNLIHFIIQVNVFQFFKGANSTTIQIKILISTVKIILQTFILDYLSWISIWLCSFTRPPRQ